MMVEKYNDFFDGEQKEEFAESLLRFLILRYDLFHVRQQFPLLFLPLNKKIFFSFYNGKLSKNNIVYMRK
jgi:hypothetical protein